MNVIDSASAICYNPTYGPTLGRYDIHVTSNFNSGSYFNFGKSYKPTDNSVNLKNERSYFTVAELEVFSLE